MTHSAQSSEESTRGRSGPDCSTIPYIGIPQVYGVLLLRSLMLIPLLVSFHPYGLLENLPVKNTFIDLDIGPSLVVRPPG